MISREQRRYLDAVRARNAALTLKILATTDLLWHPDLSKELSSEDQKWVLGIVNNGQSAFTAPSIRSALKWSLLVGVLLAAAAMAFGLAVLHKR